MCVIMTEIKTIVGGQKDVSSLEGTIFNNIKKMFLLYDRLPINCVPKFRSESNFRIKIDFAYTIQKQD